MTSRTSRKSDFPVLESKVHGKPLVYLDSAATTQKPCAVIDAMSCFYKERYGTVHRAVYTLASDSTKLYHDARECVRAFLCAESAEEVIFTKGTTESINLVAYSFGKAFVHPGDEIVISEIEHHSNIVPWQILCEDRGAFLRVVPVTDRGELCLDDLQKLLSRKTKLVAVGHISNAIGTLHPIKKICTMAHEVGARVLVDGAQAAPHMPVDVRDLDVDFYAFSGHKAYGPTGIGVLYGKGEILRQLPPYQGGGDMIEHVTLQKSSYAAPPARFEAGTPMIAEAIGLAAAIDYLQEVGLKSISTWEQELLEHAEEELRQIPGVRLIGEAPEKGAIISFTADNVHPLDIGTLLDFEGIALRTGHHCAQPAMERFGVSATARVSFGLYNDHQDVERFISALRAIVVTAHPLSHRRKPGL